jgi:G:T-mismatch repair DNA endonuclease (very short patch repair protein)
MAIPKGYKPSEETKRKIKLALNRPEVIKKFKQARKRRKQKLGYINSPEARKKLSLSVKQAWQEGKYKNANMLKKGQVHGGLSTRFKKGHEVPKEWRDVVKKNRATQIFPKKDTSIEIKIQNFLKELGIEFITHQYIKLNDSYRCDIFVPSKSLIIECDGDWFHGNLEVYKINRINVNYFTDLPKHIQIKRIRDYLRTEELISKGFKVLRLWETEIRAMDLTTFKNKLEVISR